MAFRVLGVSTRNLNPIESTDMDGLAGRGLLVDITDAPRPYSLTMDIAANERSFSL